ncbi:MAG: TolC family protein [Methylotenera sp.]
MKKNIYSLRIALGVFVILISQIAQSETVDWNVWLASQLQQHPDVAAAHEQWTGSNASADGLEQPLYNPEFSSELGRSGQDNNFTLGIQQTVDWWDRRSVGQDKAVFMRLAADAYYRQQLLEKAAVALSALVEWQTTERAASIAEDQKKQLNTLLDLAVKRQKAGDIGSIDAELAFLSLSQQLAQAAEIEVALQKAENSVRELLPQWTANKGGIPEAFWPSEPADVSDNDLLSHPLVQNAHAQWQVSNEEAVAARLAVKADPTFGVNAGRDGGDNLIGLTFSMPLNVRNNFSAEKRAANSAALEHEARFQAVYRKQRFNWQAAKTAWRRYQEQYLLWQTTVQGRVNNSAELLERQWQSGDLSTTDYLQALNQRTDSLQAGIHLEKQTRLALIEMLQQSGDLITHLDLLAKLKPTN